ncbi:hypothetical protein [Pelosinus propionicus]|uniref:Uncharacterized protein n=1 Tax=Pelosinus propionicus DSM 13327 TaxID=1123291 RepID=A0A1I4M5X7_9FIRM|nr:hypothetical protein [Pelosinus propionicus]SFL98641.1 hypothetical protein SAMN04490355_10303 [Pelosinus propionicus DSM 13327]
MKYCKWILLVGVLLSYFIAPYLPVSWGWENSLLEWLQVVILALGLFLTCVWWQEARSAGDRPAARFLIWAIPLWLLMIGRELSWGRVFYPSGFHAIDGPSFLPLSQLPYGPFVNPALAVIIIIWLWAVIKYELFKVPYRLLQEGRFPVSELIITVLAFIAAELGERHLHLQNMEEFDECFAYLGLVLTAYCVRNALRRIK